MFSGAAGAGFTEQKKDATVINVAMIAVGALQEVMTVVVCVNIWITRVMCHYQHATRYCFLLTGALSNETGTVRMKRPAPVSTKLTIAIPEDSGAMT